MREKIARFMQGRYGVDQFSNFLVMAAVVLMVLEMFIRIPLVRMIFNTVTLVLIVCQDIIKKYKQAVCGK